MDSRDSRETLRLTFTEDPDLYDRARPAYPARLFDDLAELAGLGPGRRVLEIGCGTGQFTRPVAERGCRVVALELGARMAEVARARLSAYSTVSVVTAEFETWPLPLYPFEVVASANAWHWLDPAVRVARAADALSAGGYLALVTLDHVRGGTEDFFAEVQELYERYDPATPPGLRLEPGDNIVADSTEIVQSGLFATPVARRYEWDVDYTTIRYVELLLTYSGHRALPAPRRTALLDGIADLIDSRYGGRIVKRYLAQLRVARVLSSNDRLPTAQRPGPVHR